MREVAKIRVIYGDTDQMGVVYYANYLRYFEVARNEYLRLRNSDYRAFEQSHGLFLPVVEAHVKYRQSARYDDLLAISAGIPWVKGASARFDYLIDRITESGREHLADGYTVHACLGRDGQIARIPAEFRAVLQE